MTIAIVLALALADPTSAANSDFVAPRWRTPPDSEAAAVVIPEFANAIGVSGAVTYHCTIDRPGPPLMCRTMSESLEGLGFADAGRIVLATGYVDPPRQDGRMIPGSIAVRIAFEAYPLEDNRQTVAYDGEEPDSETLQMAEEVARSMIAADPPSIIYPLGGLAADRVPIVRAWMEELMPPPDEDRIARELALILARWASPDDIRAMRNGDRPRVLPPSLDQREALTTDMFDPGVQAALEEVRARYCARWSC